ncbi:uncharacterized protein LOC128959144 [Oppia nitens]|uniref:uncharacterized protein LOC128959144 n=1 Tax=Oppia nitens TaxID=1686743 RepID=UPI0023DA412C|nr:uncharacterized protein LOC128959144 [Oppia nitens]
MSLNDERMDSKKLYDYCQLAEDITLNVVQCLADNQHNQFDRRHSDWRQLADKFTDEMKQLAELRQQLDTEVEATYKTDVQLKQLLADSEQLAATAADDDVGDDNEDNDNRRQLLTNVSVGDMFTDNLGKLLASAAKKSTVLTDNNENYGKLMEVLNEMVEDMDDADDGDSDNNQTTTATNGGRNQTNMNDGNDNDDGDDDEELVTLDNRQPKRIPIDPFSKKPIELPVRSITCGHIYDRNQLELVLKSRAADSNQWISCPTVGCSNRKLTLADVVDDRKTRTLINKLKRN